MSESTENDMITAIAAHFADEGLPFGDHYAIEVRVIADDADGTCPAHDTAAGRKVYRTAGSFVSMIGLTEFGSAVGVADPPQVRTHKGITA